MLGKAVAIVPKPGFENDIFKNPYIAYNCYRQVGDLAVVTNGSHTDPIAEKLETGMGIRDALASVMLAMDYEHDSLDTPRIAGVVRADGSEAYLAIVRKDALMVRRMTLAPGRAFYICTYERNKPCDNQVEENFTPETAADACSFIMGGGVFAELEKPVAAVCVVAKAGGGFDLAAV